MDEFAVAAAAQGQPVPEALRALFNEPDLVRVQKLPCGLPDLGSMAVHFAAGSRTVPHTHTNGQHLVISEGVGVVADEQAVHIVRAGDVVTNPPGAWHWHGALPGSAMSHVTVETPGGIDMDVDRRDWEQAYPPELGT